MPRDGVITVTGYEMISVMNPSSGAQSLVLTPAESRRLLRVADGVAVTNVDGMCHENSVIFSISVAATMGGVHSGRRLMRSARHRANSRSWTLGGSHD